MGGLDDVIGYSVVHPTWGRTKPDDPEDTHCGWHFRNPGDDPVPNSLGYGSNDCDDALIPDTVNGAKTIRALYDLANETTEILKMFDSAFNDFAKHPDRTLFPGGDE